MKKALDILEVNNFYRHLILFKLYIENNGATDKYFRNLEKDIKGLLKNDFSKDNLLTAINYLDGINYTKNRAASLTIAGVEYF
ncbi:hypothetical protein [Psychroflexus tropicus]|uniref:hypothetical protein n=1 Tax=Psychroflexus tropicus TaxID=197345 RepID=UPI00037A1ADF|nr:hypothetical protein [Psychroflexus tropicus]